MTLYELEEQYADFLSKVESGEIPDEAIEDTLEAIDGAYENKVDQIACIIKEMNARADGIKTEKDRLNERLTTLKGKTERLKDYLRQSMEKTGKSRIETSRNRVTLGAASEAVTITDLTKLRGYEKAWKTYAYDERNVDKTLLKTILKAGESVPGAALQTGKPRLTIK